MDKVELSGDERQPRVDIAHEALIDGWPALRQWVDERRDEEQVRRRLEDKAREWIRLGGGQSGLLDTVELAEAERWLAGSDAIELGWSANLDALVQASQAELTAAEQRHDHARREREALLKARADADRRRVSWLRVFLTVASVLLALAVGVTIYALQQRQTATTAAEEARREAHISAAQAFAGESLFELSRGNTDRALLLAQAAIVTDTHPYSSLVIRDLHQVLEQSAHTVLGTRTSSILTAAWAPYGRQVLTGSQDGTARLWDVASGQLIRSFEGHASWVKDVAWAPDGRQVLTGSEDGAARLWDVASGQLIRTFEGHTNGVNAVAWSLDGKLVLTGGADSTAHVWDVASGQVVQTLIHPSGVNAVAWSPDGRQVLTGSYDSIVRLWNVTSGQLIRKFEGQMNGINAVAWAPDGKQILTGATDSTARIWDVASGQAIRILEGHTSSVNVVAWKPDGKRILTGSMDGTAHMWDVATGQVIRILKGHTSSVSSVAWAPNGEQILTLDFIHWVDKMREAG